MDLRFFFFLALLKLCLSSSLDETSEAPNEEVFSYFSQLLTGIKRDPSFSITSDDYDKIRDLYKHSPLDCMLSLVALTPHNILRTHNPHLSPLTPQRTYPSCKLIYLTCLAIWNIEYVKFQQNLEQNPFGMNQKSHFEATVQRIFACFNEQILFKLREEIYLR